MLPDPHSFAANWQDGWNSHDLDRILSHYTEDVRFHSRKAEALVGQPVLQGKNALRDYWGKALARQPDLRFEVCDVFKGASMLALTYRNHRDVLAVEHFWFDASGLVHEAAALHRDHET